MSNTKEGSKGYLYCICAVAIIGGLLFGYDTAVVSGAEQALQKFFIAGLGAANYGKFLHGFVTSSALVGCIIGGLISGVMADHIGRRNSLMVSSVLFFLSALGSYMPEFMFRSDFSLYKPEESSSAVMWAFVFYRILGGVGVGMASAICPMYIAEISPSHIRGKLVSFNQLAIIVGQLVVYAINTVIRKCLGSTPEAIEDAMVKYGWRRMFVSEAVPAALFGVLLFFVPKTPRFLVMKKEEDKAQNVLARINGEEKSKEILEEIKDTLKNEKKEKLLTYGITVILVGSLLSFFQQAVGINVVLYYGKRIFEISGASGDTAMIQTVVMGVINVFFTFVAIFTVEKWGRKPLLTMGSIGMFIGMTVLGILFLKFSDIFNDETKTNATIGILTLIFVIVYTASFMMSWGPICWVLISEIFPNSIRGGAVSIAVAVQWTFNLIVSTTFPYLSDWSAGGTYLMYAFFSALSAVFVFFMVPETKGKTLEDMNELWLSRSKKNVNKLPY